MEARQIKFRAWITDWMHREPMMVYCNDGEKEEGSYFCTGNKLFQWNNDIYAGWDVSEVQPIAIMQSTGLKDKNGNEIFEGDILKIERWSTLFKVIWDDFYAKFTVKKMIEGGKNMDYIVESSCEIIGNIYENSELIKNLQPNNT